MLDLGDSVILPDLGHDGRHHLWVLVTKQMPTTFEVIMVNITTKKPDSDMTTVLNVGDHPFITRPSVVYYIGAQIVNMQKLNRAISLGAWQTHSRFSLSVVKRIQDGICLSPQTHGKIKNAWNAAYKMGLV